MNSLFANVCWPSRFFSKWIAVFCSAIICGLILGHFLPPHAESLPHAASTPPAISTEPDHVQARFEVYLSHAGKPPKRVAADLYYVTRGQIDKGKKIYVPSTGYAWQTDSGGSLITFKVQPLDAFGNNDGEPVMETRRWPTKENAIVSITIARDPSHPSGPRAHP